MKQKRLGVSAEPDLTLRELGEGEYAFLVMVSDGVSGVLGDQEVVDIVKEAGTCEEAAKELCEFADEVGEEGKGDNVTAVVVRLGGWEKRQENGGGEGTRGLRHWRREEAVGGWGRGRMN